jgi:ribosome biogenesis GTPase
MARKKPGRKLRVDFRQNRAQPGRSDDWTRRYQADDEHLGDEQSVESVRAKGDLSRKRTILVDENEAPIVDESLWQPGIVTSIQGPVCRIDDGRDGRWDCTVRRVLKTLLIAQRNAVAVGDRVWFAPIERGTSATDVNVGVIERVEPRRGTLTRGARIGHDARRGGHRREHVIAANVDQLLIVAAAAQPRFKPHLIDRYLVAAARGDLRPIVCVNKCDLLDEAVDFEDEEFENTGQAPMSVDELLEEFRSLGYACLRTSATRGDGLDELRGELKNKVTVLSGQSGVGKSSLLNAIQPGLDLLVGDISEENEKGRHTTTHATLLALNFGGYVVDTPGIRSFDLWNVAPGELEACFVEFVPHVPNCRFRDCHHRDEEDCAIVAAVENGEISERRYFSYLKMLGEISRA